VATQVLKCIGGGEQNSLTSNCVHFAGYVAVCWGCFLDRDENENESESEKGENREQQRGVLPILKKVWVIPEIFDTWL